MAPEMINKHNYSYPADVWSLGMVLLHLANRGLPNQDSPFKAMFTVATGIVELQLNGESWSEDIKDCTPKCLDRNQTTRITIDALLGHAFIAKASLESLVADVASTNASEADDEK